MIYSSVIVVLFIASCTLADVQTSAIWCTHFPTEVLARKQILTMEKKAFEDIYG